MRDKLRIILALVIFHLLSRGPAWAIDERIAVIMSRRLAPFYIALEGFQEIVDSPCQVFDLAVDETGVEKIIREIAYDSPPRLILTIGSEALGFAQKNFSHLPIVFTMVSNPSRIVQNRKQKISGVRMETSWKEMFTQLTEIAPLALPCTRK